MDAWVVVASRIGRVKDRGTSTTSTHNHSTLNTHRGTALHIWVGVRPQVPGQIGRTGWSRGESWIRVRVRIRVGVGIGVRVRVVVVVRYWIRVG